MTPSHWEVQRRLSWFVGSLFMDVPTPPPVAAMRSWSTLTPFCNEDLLYSPQDLAQKNEDGVSVLYYLKTVHPDEWRHFLERVGVKPSNEQLLFQDASLVRELRLWASFRGQTLVRTVEGIMLAERALRLQARWEGLSGDGLEDMVRQKFTYVVSCQLYGQHKAKRDAKSADTDFLLQRFANLRVAYVDKKSETDARSMQESIRHFSVLIKGAKEGDGPNAEEVVQEVYRVQLPGDIMLGEGKPENQNHAMIFTRGECVQTIDMNQCGYLEEAFKMRNLLHEFTRHPGASIVGFREHIFTGALSSLASYMALQEGCFVTITQRVLWQPLEVRLHYGHPDVFDKIFSMTRGGVSKASRGINLSEDIYAGFNHLLRGGTIPYVEYMQVGKGRDVGNQQIYKFEAKLASGNAEQCLSRDVHRIANRLDFTRLLSFYYSGTGFYFNNAVTVFAMFFFLYLQLFSHILQLDDHVPNPDLLNAQWSLQLGLLLTVPIFCFLSVEHGLGHAVKHIGKVFATGAPLFFMFHMGTKAYYFDSTLKYGGAKYRPTGRGFVMRHEDFAELYRFYASSHLYNGFELLWGLLLLCTLGDWGWGGGDDPAEKYQKQYPGGIGTYWRTAWSLWTVMVAWLFSPFWFNPLAFDVGKLKEDLARWRLWMQRKDADPMLSWESWWREEHAFVATSSWLKKLHMVLPSIRYGLVAVGILASASGRPLHEGLLGEVSLFGAVVGGIAVAGVVIASLSHLLRCHPALLRVLTTLLLLLAVVAVPAALAALSLFDCLLLAAAAGYLAAALVRLPYAAGALPTPCMYASKAYDYLLGALLLALCFVLSYTPGVKALQNRALLSNEFDQRVKYNELQRLLEVGR